MRVWKSAKSAEATEGKGDTYGFSFAPAAFESGRMYLKMTSVTAGNAAASTAKITGMYWLGIALLPQRAIVTHRSTLSQNSSAPSFILPSESGKRASPPVHSSCLRIASPESDGS